MSNKRLNILAAILFLFLAWLFFANLSDHALWNDEAFTSVIAKNTLKFGYPRSFDGVNYLYPDSPWFNYPGTYASMMDHWLPIYAMALSFKIFGISTWSARILFVTLGFLTVVLLFMFCLRYLKSWSMGILSILLLGTSVPFLLHIRQARYYAMSVFLCIALFYLYHRIVEQQKGYFWFSVVAILLSLTNRATFVSVFGTLWLIALTMDRSDIRWRRFIIASILPLVCFSVWVALTWFIMVDPNSFPVNTSLIEIKKNFEFQLRTINKYFMPIAFWIIIAVLLKVFKKPQIFRPSTEESKILRRIYIILVCNIVFFTVFGLRTMRYYAHYLPFLCLIQAFLIHRIFNWKKPAAVVIIVLAIFTNFLARPNPLFLTKGLPGRLDVSENSKFRTYFLSHIYELTHEYTGPLEALCDYLDLNAKPGDRIKIVKGDLTVMFYNPELTVLNDARYFKKSLPEWIVIRKYWNPIYEGLWKNKLKADIEEGYLDVLRAYEKIPLPAVDSIRENEPDNLEEHFFKSPEVTPRNQMFVYRLKGA